MAAQRLKLNPKVDAAAWKTFLADYLAAADRLLAPYEHARTTAEYRFTTTDGHGEATTFCRTIRSVRSKMPSRSLWIQTEDEEEIYLAHPSGSLEAHRKRPTRTMGDPERIRSVVLTASIAGFATALNIWISNSRYRGLCSRRWTL